MYYASQEGKKLLNVVIEKIVKVTIEVISWKSWN